MREDDDGITRKAIELDEEYRRNDYNDEMVDALNALPDEERTFMVLFIAAGNNKAALAKHLGCGRTSVNNRLEAIRVKIQAILRRRLYE